MSFENLPVDPAALPGLEEVTYVEHPIRYRTKRVVTLSFFFLILLAGSVIVFLTAPLLAGVISASAIIVLYALFVFMIFREFPKRAYALRQRDITYRKGWIFHSVTTVPFNRIQHSEISQGPVDRLFKLASLNIYTAGGSSSDLTVPGLPYDDAVRLREFIAKKSAADE